VLFGDQQQVARFRADLLDRRHRRLDRQRQHLLRQVVEAAGEQVGVDRRELEACIAHVDRGVERRRVLHPLEPEPAFDGRQRFEDALLELIDRAGECGDEMRNHVPARKRRRNAILGMWGGWRRSQAGRKKGRLAAALGTP
jgi:hypothetical protein